jgi:hypothetical protein
MGGGGEGEICNILKMNGDFSYKSHYLIATICIFNKSSTHYVHSIYGHEDKGIQLSESEDCAIKLTYTEHCTLSVISF